MFEGNHAVVVYTKLEFSPSYAKRKVDRNMWVYGHYFNAVDHNDICS